MGQAVIGSDEFVHKVLKKVTEGKELFEITAKRVFSGGPGAGELQKAVCEHYGLEDLIGNRRAREIFVALARESGNVLNREIAEKIGVTSPSAVTHIYKRTLEGMKADKRAIKQWDKDKSVILSRFKG